MKSAHGAQSFRIVGAVILLVGAIAGWGSPSFALDGQVQIHDPSTPVLCDGKWYTYGTGGTALVSDDGWTWRAGTRASRSGAAPDVIKVGDKYFQYISGVTMIWTKSLNPESPDYGWQDAGTIAGMEGPDDFMNPIDPGLFLDPTDGKLWMTYGSYFGFTRVVELDPKTGLRADDKYYNVAVNCEATTMIYHDGWYYLLATHGSCCQGPSSGYNIRVGRSKRPTGPFVDHMAIDMMHGGGKLVMGTSGRLIGPGHFGLMELGDGVQKFALHWEADLDRGGASVIDIVPLLWRDGWPLAGENFKAGTFSIESVRTGTSLELAVDGVPVGGRRGGRGGRGGARRGDGAGAPRGDGAARGDGAPRGDGPPRGDGARGDIARGDGGRGFGRGGGGGRGLFGGTGGVIADQNVAEVSANWPMGNVDMRLANYMSQAQQKWSVTPVADAGGYPGSPYFKITITGTDRTLAVDDNKELVALPAFTGGNEQLWRLDQLADGTWRIMPKTASIAGESLALSAIGSSFASLTKFDPTSDKHGWVFRAP